ncbi:glycosyl hydrolase family 30 TIM-barrel domain-containing protein [Phthorimaea operculella]|nr:glycosyl hydrolase family 30 TIM-barrel domain-containing protein [Phthorimaea operculella]
MTHTRRNIVESTCLLFVFSSYFSENGLEYNFVRVPIGGSDYSERIYSYNDLPENDIKLSNFSLAREDYEYKLPMLKEIMKTSKTPIHIIGTTWAPPLWMKSNGKVTGFSHLKEEYYQSYADYHIKFLEQYKANGVDIWGITTTNEPVNGIIPIARFNSLGWTPDRMGKWIVNNLGPTIRNSTFKDLMILTHDDQRAALPIWFDGMIKQHPKVLDYIDGVGVHYYTDFIAPAFILSKHAEKYPEKFIIATEACEGSFPWNIQKVILGSWTRARHYIEDILEDLNHAVSGWIDWNICLNEEGGPNWQKNFVDSPVIVLPQNEEFVKQPMFYAMGHFSKFILRGSIRIKADEDKKLFSKSVKNVAFLTPKGTVVVVLYNGGNEKTVAIRLGDQQATVKMVKHSVATVEMAYDYSNSTATNETS